MKEKQFKEKIKYGVVPVSIVLQALLLVLQLQCITFADCELLWDWLSMDNIFYIFYNLLFYVVLLFAGYQIWKRITPGYCILGVVTILIGGINNMKWNSLKECVTISDFSKLSEAFKVAGNAEFHFWTGTWLAVVMFVVSIFLWIYTDLQFRRRGKWPADYRKALFGVLGMILVAVMVTDGRKSAVAKLTETIYAERTGPLVYFVESLFQWDMNDAYGIQEARDSYEQYVKKGKEIVADSKEQAGASQEHPNIIVIMSEAFYDLDRLEGAVNYSKDPMESFHKVSKEGITGDVYVNVYGGSTHFTEFEFLTGWNTRGMSSGSCPYKEYFSDEQPSFARYLKEQGYDTLAIHPYDGKFWNRYIAYPRLGFDQFIDRYRMTFQEKCGYISDESLTKEIIKQYEKKRPDTPLFCFAVSVANHIAILNGEEKENVPDDITVTYDAGLSYGSNKKRWVQEYVSGIAKSGEALEMLTEYLKQQDEPTIVVFFGDHAPSYALDQLKLEEKDENLAYSTPYLIWGNYDWNKNVIAQNVSASYLSTYLMQLLGMPLTAQNYYNIGMHEEYPVETRYMIKDKEGRLYQQFSKEEQQMYYRHALDLKKHVETLLRSPEIIQDIWSVEK